MPFSQYNNGGSSSKWRRPSSFSSSVDQEQDPYSTEALDRQIENAKVRIADAGYEADKDERNWFEKMTNLPEGQNGFFDVLELLGRPGQGVMNSVKQQNHDPLKNIPLTPVEGFNRAMDFLTNKTPHADLKTTTGQFLEGLSGRETTRGSELAEQLYGIESKPGKFAAGLGLEIGLDPLNLIPAGAIANTTKTATKGAKAAYNGLEELVPALRSARDVAAPAASAVKDGLGKIFVPQYKWDETLDGAKDDTLKRLYNQTDNDIKFQTEEALRNVADVAKTTGIKAGDDVGRLMEKDLKLYGPRPYREASSDPAIQQAAQSLTESNDMIRQWAKDNDIAVNEIEGYMTHILSAEERAGRKVKKPISVDRGNFGTGQPNKKILNARTLEGSVEDVNEQIGRKFFEPNAYFATAIGQKRLIEFGNAVKFRREVLSNPDFAVPFEKGMIVPENATVINTNNYSFMKDPSRTLPEEIGGDYVVTKGVKEALDRYQKLTTDEGVNAFLKGYDSVQNTWKKFALFSPMYHVRNQIGGMFNNWIGGMNQLDLSRYTTSAIGEVTSAIRGKESPLYREYRQQGLGSTNLSKVEFRHGNEPEKEITKLIEERSKGPLQQVTMRLNPLRAFESSRELGDVVDQTNRFALYKWAREKKGMTPDEAAAKVREVQFDYTKTTKAEKEILTRAIPFYRWMRNNIPFQIQQFINDPRKYSNFNKLRLNAQDAAGIDDENVPDYMKQSFAIPVAGDGDGSGKFLSLNLPIGDLTKVANPTDALKTTIDSVSPLLKLPAEYNLNRNFFYNKPIEKFEGQEKQFAIPGTDLEYGVPIKTAYILEQLGGQIGRGFSQYLQKPEEEDLDTKYRMPSLGISSAVKDFDVEQSRFYQLLDQLRRLQDQMDYIEQQTGVRPRTLQEIRR